MSRSKSLFAKLVVQKSDSLVTFLNKRGKTSEFRMDELIQTFKTIRGKCKELFPTFTDLGYELRETRFIPLINIAVFICGTGTIGKLFLANNVIATYTIPEVRLMNFTVCIQQDTLFLIGINISSRVEKKSVLVQVKLSTLEIEKKLYSDENISQIFSCEEDNKLRVLTEKGIFLINFTSDLPDLQLEEIFSGQFSCFKYSQNEWLLGEQTGKIKRINKNGQTYTSEVPGVANLLKYSRSGKYVMALVDKTLILFNLHLKHCKTVELKYQLNGVRMDSYEKNIFLSTDKGYIVIFSLFTDQTLYIPVHRNEIVHFWVDEKLEKVFTFGKDSKMSKFSFPNLSDSKAEGFHSLNFVFCGTNPDLVFIESKTRILRWNFIEGQEAEIVFESKSELSKCLDYFSAKDLLLFSEIQTIIIMNATSKVITRSIRISSSTIIGHCRFSYTGSHFFTFAEQNTFIYCFNATEDGDPKKFKGHEGRINCQANIKGTNFIVTGGNDCRVIMWDYISGKKKETFKGHTGVITCVQTTREGNKIISGSNDKSIKVWDWRNKQLIISLETFSPIVKIRVDDLNQMLSVSAEGTMIYWNLRAYVKIFKYNLNSDVTDFSLSADYQWAAYTDSTGMKVIPFPTHTNRFDVIGPNNEDKYKYIYYIYKMLKGDVVEYSQMWDDWAVLPYQFNTLLFYSYANLYKNLKRSIQGGSFLIPAPSADPYTIAAKKNYERCLKVFFESTKQILDSNSHSLSFISPKIITYLNKLGHSSLHTFYHNIFRKYTSSSFPKFIDRTLLPSVNFSKSLHPQYDIFFSKSDPNYSESFDSNKKNSNRLNLSFQGVNTNLFVPVLLYVSSIRFDFTNGSHSSIGFLTSIIQCGNTEIFKTKYIQTILNKKWKDLRIYQLYQASAYTFYIMSLIFYLIVFYDSAWAFGCLVVIAGLLACFDIVQMSTNFYLFWKDIWNYFDLTRTMLFVVYSCLFFFDWNKEMMQEVMVGICFVSFTRGIAFFRIFDDTRYLIQLIICVIKDCKSFIIILSYSTISFSIIRMVEDSRSKSFFEYLKEAIMVNLGELGESEQIQSFFGWAIFAIMGIINLIILLNMLIAIMGDTFTKVRENSEVANYTEIAQMVLEIETIYVLKNHKENKTYLQLCEEDTSDDAGADEDPKKTQKYLKMLVKQFVRK